MAEPVPPVTRVRTTTLDVVMPETARWLILVCGSSLLVGSKTRPRSRRSSESLRRSETSGRRKEVAAEVAAAAEQAEEPAEVERPLVLAMAGVVEPLIFSIPSVNGRGVGRPRLIFTGRDGSRSFSDASLVHAFFRGSKPRLSSASWKARARGGGCQQNYCGAELLGDDS